jgi:subtilisin
LIKFPYSHSTKENILKIAILPMISILLASSMTTEHIAIPVNAQNTSGVSNPSGNATTASEVNTATQAGRIVPGQFIVTLKENATISPASFTETSQNVSAEAADQGFKAVKGFPQLGIVVVNTTQSPSALSAAEIDQGISSLQTNPNVQSIEPNRIVQIANQTIPTGVQRIGAEQSATRSGHGNGTSVNANIGIIDTGIDLKHPDLNVVSNVSFVSGTNSGNDDNGHGTHVAGIAAAKDNGIGVVGVAPGAKLWAIKVLNSAGLGTTADIIAGINYAADHAKELDVINLSLSGRGVSPGSDAAIDRAVNRGLVVVVAAGNNHEDASGFTPANSPNAIAVSALADSDGKCGGKGNPLPFRGGLVPDDSFAPFSNWGPVVNIMAPGMNINSTYLNGGYRQLSGTSMASPHVTGAVAVFKSLHPNATPSQVRAALLSTASNPTSTCDGDGRGYLVNRDEDLDLVAEPLLYEKGLAPPAAAGSVLTPQQALQYTMKATDTRVPGSMFTVTTNSIEQLKSEINKLVQGLPPALTASSTNASQIHNDTAITNNVDRGINNLLTASSAAVSGAQTNTSPGAITNNLAGIKMDFCFNVSWFKICIEVS